MEASENIELVSKSFFFFVLDKVAALAEKKGGSADSVFEALVTSGLLPKKVTALPDPIGRGWGRNPVFCAVMFSLESSPKKSNLFEALFFAERAWEWCEQQRANKGRICIDVSSLP